MLCQRCYWFNTFNFIIIVIILWDESENHEYTDNCIIFIIHCGCYFQFFPSQNVVAVFLWGGALFYVITSHLFILLDFNARRLPNFNFNFNLLRLAPFTFHPFSVKILTAATVFIRYSTWIVSYLNIADS